VNNLYKRISSLSLFAKTGGRVQPIPFQIDEKTEEGEWVLPSLPPCQKESKRFSKKIEEDEDNGCVDENDELVFMIGDSGDQISKEEYPEGALTVDEIKLIDPVNNTASWVYLCSFASAPPLSDKDYVSYVFPDNRIVTTNYEMGFSAKLPISWDHLSFRGEPNMVDRFKVRINVKMMGIKFHWNESHILSDPSSFKDGPIRVIRRVHNSIKLNRILKSPKLASETTYYQNAVLMPFRLNIPINPKAIKKMFGLSLTVQAGVDLQNLHGWNLLSDVDPGWLTIDGCMDEKELQIEKLAADKESTWWVLKGDPGAFFIRVVLDRSPEGDKRESPIKTHFFYTDDDNAPSPPEFVPGQSPFPGWWISHMEDLPKGPTYFYIIGFLVNDFNAGDEVDLLNIVDQPVQVIMN